MIRVQVAIKRIIIFTDTTFSCRSFALAAERYSLDSPIVFILWILPNERAVCHTALTVYAMKTRLYQCMAFAVGTMEMKDGLDRDLKQGNFSL